MAKKFYVVWQGREPGIYTDWNSCKKQVDKFAGAKYKSFPSLAEAEQAFVGSHDASSTKKSRPAQPSASIIWLVTSSIEAMPSIDLSLPVLA